MTPPVGPTADPFRTAHQTSDVDRERSSQHHTLGQGTNQAAAGNELAALIKRVGALEAVNHHPVGSIYLSVDNVNPAGLFGGVWIAWGSGKVPVGIDAAQAEFDTVEETGGFKTHTLTASEMPIHNHGGGPLSVDTSNAVGGSASRLARGTATVTGNITPISGSTADAGNGQPHNNLQPYIVCYMWKRTA